MKRSTEARSYAYTLFCQWEKEIAIDRDNQLQQILATADSSNPRLLEITSLLYEKHKQLLLAKVDPFLRAYRLYGYVLDTNDEKEIRIDLLNYTNEQFNYVLRLRGLMNIECRVPDKLLKMFHSINTIALVVPLSRQNIFTCGRVSNIL